MAYGGLAPMRTGIAMLVPVARRLPTFVASGCLVITNIDLGVTRMLVRYAGATAMILGLVPWGPGGAGAALHLGVPAVLNPVLLGVGTLVVVAIVWSRSYPGLVRYPVTPWEPSPPSLNWGGWLE